jgi:hypothetical protein
MRKRKWKPEYRCEKLGMYIIEKVKWCNENFEKNCEGCPHNKGFKTAEVRVIDSVRAEQHKIDLRTRRKSRKSGHETDGQFV